MGIYLSTPKTDKLSEDGENDRLRYGVSSMQGWRSTMEDAGGDFCKLRWQIPLLNVLRWSEDMAVLTTVNSLVVTTEHAAYLDLDASTAFFGVYDGHGGKQ
ncbi:unnamed protein product [Thlaspi arvense]|uniref:Protein-serine/threonine phosphatase n=1 Tax=Thlaspi arvense TaxID=13288 RepID=A0AAU9RJJ7_THLAR|nr:unnamed protein product [Thlaspi arvense]